jgi:multidrug efflux pump subunit AcrB
MEKHNANGGQIMFKLFRKKDMKSSEDLLRESFKNTATRKFNVSSWNPAQLPLPKENHFKALVKGDRDSIRIATSKLRAFLKEKDLYDRIRTDPNTKESFYYIFKPNIERLNIINSSGASVFLSDIAEISKLASSPISLGKLNYKNKPTDMKMSFNDKRFTDPDALNAYPIKIQDKIIPLNSIGHFETEQRFSEQLYLNQQSLVSLTAVIDGESKNWEALFFNAKNVVEKGLKEIVKNTNAKIEIEYPQIELKNSLNQLRDSLLISLALIFFILWMQFQSVKQVGVIMMTIPLGIVGVLISLYVFGSYLSLNSALGIILLNGITVNNSILLTDVTNTLRLKGLRGEDLIISAAKKRLRPILITSLTTILGMLPVALGIGDGGKILQPLGIAVCCGLFIATGLTLFIVPTLLYRKENDLVETQTHSVETPLEFETENRPIL